MAIGTHISIITLNGNELTAPTKRHRLPEWIQKQTLNNKMAIGTYISIITLNENGLNVPTKRHRLAE